MLVAYLHRISHIFSPKLNFQPFFLSVRSFGTAVAVTDEELIAGSHELARHSGIFPAPEGGATLAALHKLRDQGLVGGDERVVLFNTGTGYKYLELLGQG